jgi:4'-phosphopantetheinyl transferase EntD
MLVGALSEQLYFSSSRLTSRATLSPGSFRKNASPLVLRAKVARGNLPPDEAARAPLWRLGVPPRPILIGTRRQAPLATQRRRKHHALRRILRGRGGARHEFCTVGIDAEPNVALPAATRHLILCDEERLTSETLSRGIHGDTLVFSAKRECLQGLLPADGRMAGI